MSFEENLEGVTFPVERLFWGLKALWFSAKLWVFSVRGMDMDFLKLCFSGIFGFSEVSQVGEMLNLSGGVLLANKYLKNDTFAI